MASRFPEDYDGWWVELNVLFRTTDVRIYEPEDVQIKNMQNVFTFFKQRGWTANAISGMLGNMMVESSVNPWYFQHHSLDWSDPTAIMNDPDGMGLTQWTPCSKYYGWAVQNGYDPQSGWSMCQRIEYERINNIQWSLDNYGQHTWEEFVTSTETPEILARVFLWAYERPSALPTPEQEAERIAQRGANAKWVYQHIGGGLTPAKMLLLARQNKRKELKPPCRRI